MASDTVQGFEGIVEIFHPAENYPPYWYSVKIQGRETPTFVHYNRIRELGTLKPGDKIRFQISKVRPYDDDATYMWKLERQLLTVSGTT